MKKSIIALLLVSTSAVADWEVNQETKSGYIEQNDSLQAIVTCQPATKQVVLGVMLSAGKTRHIVRTIDLIVDGNRHVATANVTDNMVIVDIRNTVDYLKKGLNVKIRVPSLSDMRVYRAKFSLMGFTEAYNKVKKECKW